MKNSSKSKKPNKIVKKLILTIIGLIVLAALGLSIAGNVLQYQKWQALSASAPDNGDEPPVNAFKPIDSSVPVSLSADGEGQHLYLNMNKSDLREYGELEEFYLIALKEPYSGDENDLYEIFEGGFVFVIQSSGSGFALFSQNEENSFLLYDVETDDFWEGVTEEGVIVFDSVLEDLGVDEVYIYPFINIVSVQFLKNIDFSIEVIAGIDEVNSVLAFSSFELKFEEEKPPVVDPPTVDPPVNEFKPIDSSLPVSLRADGEGQHLYINTDKEVLDEIKNAGGDLLLVAFYTADFNCELVIDRSFSFALTYSEGAILLELPADSACIIYDFNTQQFNSEYISDDGYLILDGVGVSRACYICPAIILAADDTAGIFSYCFSLDEVNKLFAFSPFEK